MLFKIIIDFDDSCDVRKNAMFKEYLISSC